MPSDDITCRCHAAGIACCHLRFLFYMMPLYLLYLMIDVYAIEPLLLPMLPLPFRRYDATMPLYFDAARVCRG